MQKDTQKHKFMNTVQHNKKLKINTVANGFRKFAKTVKETIHMYSFYGQVTVTAIAFDEIIKFYRFFIYLPAFCHSS